jgi:hypothetical protein
MVTRFRAPLGYVRRLLKDSMMATELTGALKSPRPTMGEALTL